MATQTPVPGCTEHPGMGFVYVCKTCNNDLICMDCVVGRHNKHDLGNLTEFVSEQTHQIQQYKEKLSKSDIPKVESDIKENEEGFKESRKEFRQMIDDIKRQGEKMKKGIDLLTDRLVKLCSDLAKMNEDIKEKNENVLTKYLTEELRPQLDKCQRVRTSGTNNDVIAAAKEFWSTQPTTPPHITTLMSVVFKPGTVSNAILGQLLGTVLVDGENTSLRPIPPCTVISRFYPPRYYNYNVCRTCTGNAAWLSSWKEEQIYRVDMNGNVKERIKCKVKVKSMTTSPTTGRVWFCVKEDRSIREVTSDGNIVTHFKVGSTPRSLCITQEDMVVVGMEDGISLYSKDGSMVPCEAGGVCRQDAVHPHHMAYSRTTGDVAVADNDGISCDEYMAGKEPEKQPSVIVMDKHLKLKFQCRYIDGMESQPDDSLQSRFYPNDVCFDGAGDVLVAECVTKSVVLIDGNNGLFFRIIYVTEGMPWCISLHDDKSLWIRVRGSETTEIIRY